MNKILRIWGCLAILFFWVSTSFGLPLRTNMNSNNYTSGNKQTSSNTLYLYQGNISTDIPQGNKKLADHFSHTSHYSHESHYSHYSSQ